MLKWAIFYADGNVVTSEESAPADVPGFGVQAIAQPDRTAGTGNVGYRVERAWEWYYWRDDEKRWRGASNDRSILDLIRRRAPIAGVSSGEQLPDDRFAIILAAAEKWAEEQRLPIKSGSHSDETTTV